MRLSYATAAYKAEVRRLGDIVIQLLQRPTDKVDDRTLLHALKATKEEAARMKRKWWRRLSIPQTSKYSLSWNAEGSSGLVSIRKLESNSQISPSSAVEALLSEDEDSQYKWLEETRSWIYQSRTVICRAISEALQGTVHSDAFNYDDFAKVEKDWCVPRYTRDTDIDWLWTMVVQYADNLQRWRRVGEGKVIRLQDAAVLRWARTLDVFGIVPSLLWIGAAHYVHDWIDPRWSDIKADLVKAYTTAILIFRQRFWEPVVGIWNDLMNKETPGMMSALSVEDEENALDAMLQDMGFGDGTEKTRMQALQEASEQYTEDIDSGVMKNIFRGRLVRSLLVQIQQLKVGLLSALDTVDRIMRSNQINFQLLAAIPAVLIVNYGTRVVARFIFRLRSRDLRPLTAIHSEMAEYLSSMQDVMLLTDDECVQRRQQERNRQGGGSRRNADGFTKNNSPLCGWQPEQIGQLLLYEYRYLVLLDFSCPPLPGARCDAIHTSLEELLSDPIARLGTTRQVQWLEHIQQKHKELVKHL